MKPRWLLPIVLIVLIFTASAGLVAKTIYAEPGESAATPVLPNESAVPASELPGDPTVQGTTDAAEHPLYEPIRAALQTFMNSINAKDYRLWRTVVTKERAVAEPESDWRGGYRTTTNGNILIRRIELRGADSARVLYSFTSMQDPADAPDELPESCINWQLVLPFAVEGKAWKITTGLSTTGAQAQAC